MQPYCLYCDLQQDGVVTGTGSICCYNCGKVIMENDIVEEVVFDDQGKMQGAFVKSWGYEIASLESSINRGRAEIRRLLISLSMDDKIESMAFNLYKRAAQRKFTRRYRIDYVAAACLYVACRATEQPYLLIDFSEDLAVNVYVLGAVYLQLCLLLYISDDPIIQKPVDPSLFIHKFTKALVEKLEEDSGLKNDTIEEINRTALRIIASMKRDWMQTGRKPSGLCGAAIYIAALSHGYRFPKSEVITVVHICEATLTKRLIEFENTESGGLTIREFEERAKNFETEQFDVGTNKSGRTEVLCEHKEREVCAHGLCQECNEEFIELSGGLKGGADPPSFQRSECEEVAPGTLENVNDPSSNCSLPEDAYGSKSQDTSGQYDNIMMDAAEKLAEHQFKFNLKESEDKGNCDPESLSDIDDQEVMCYLNNEEEAHYKEIIWKQMNKEYLEEYALKEAAKEGSYSDMVEMTDEMREARKLAAAASEAVALARKQKRHQRVPTKNAAPRTAAEATAGVLNNKGNRKINIDALQQLFDEDDMEMEHATKKSRKEPEDEIGGSDDQEVDDVNYDEVDQDYQEQADYEPDPYDNDDGNNEPDNFSYYGDY